MKTIKAKLYYVFNRLLVLSLLTLPSAVLDQDAARFILAGVQGGDNRNSFGPLVTNKPTLISICKGSNGYVSLEEIYQFCGVPRPCGKEMDCEGKTAKVEGYVDYSNVFDRKTYPWLPYEKFRICTNKGKSLDIWVTSHNNSKIFDKIYHNKKTPEKMAFIKGKIVGFDMPSTGACHRGTKINLEKENDIFFQY